MLLERIISHPLLTASKKHIRQLFYEIFPPICLLCLSPTKRHRNICEPCQKMMPSLAHSCRKCAQFLHGTRVTPLCGDCLKHSPPFDRAFALGPYHLPWPMLITGLKFKGNLTYARALGELMTDAIIERWYRHEVLPEAIIPVPLHESRLRHRGFNQAFEIAKPIRKLLHLPIDTHIARRIKATLPQSGLSAEDRMKNVNGAFQVCHGKGYQHIAVLDDVMTTGETLRVLCLELKKSGISRVDVWCCARR